MFVVQALCLPSQSVIHQILNSYQSPDIKQVAWHLPNRYWMILQLLNKYFIKNYSLAFYQLFQIPDCKSVASFLVTGKQNEMHLNTLKNNYF